MIDGRIGGLLLAIGCLLAATGPAAAGVPDSPDSPVVNAARPVAAMDEPTTGPTSLGQQPLPTEQPADTTPSQANNSQFNQLFQLESTPDICAAGEGYISGQFDYLKFPGSVRQYRYQVQGQYGLTDQLAVGAFIPIIHADFDGHHTGTGDVGVYGQYKFDRIINPEIVDLSAQLDMILPTGSNSELRDSGHFGVRPLVLAYKDFGQQGPGTLSAYGLMGFTITTDSDFRLGLAAAYTVQRLSGVLEFFDTTGNRLGRPLVDITPGLVYRPPGGFEIAAGIPLGVNNGSPHWGVTFKLTYAFAQ